MTYLSRLCQNYLELTFDHLFYYSYFFIFPMTEREKMLLSQHLKVHHDVLNQSDKHFVNLYTLHCCNMIISLAVQVQFRLYRLCLTFEE